MSADVIPRYDAQDNSRYSAADKVRLVLLQVSLIIKISNST